MLCVKLGDEVQGERVTDGEGLRATGQGDSKIGRTLMSHSGGWVNEA